MGQQQKGTGNNVDAHKFKVDSKQGLVGLRAPFQQLPVRCHQSNLQHPRHLCPPFVCEKGGGGRDGHPFHATTKQLLLTAPGQVPPPDSSSCYQHANFLQQMSKFSQVEKLGDRSLQVLSDMNINFTCISFATKGCSAGAKAVEVRGLHMHNETHPPGRESTSKDQLLQKRMAEVQWH
eukprot:1157375-Pelagomonas_calceolata.AAC.10